MERGNWASRSTFILAAVGSAVGLGNAWRFPGLVAKHGGGAFLIVYLLAMLLMGVPLLMMEISIGRKTKSGAPGAFRKINKKFEWIGWAATTNAFVITTYYAVVFGWVLVMAAFSFKFAGMTGDAVAASNLFASITKTTWTVENYDIPLAILIGLLVAWGLIYICIKDGAKSVSSVVKYTVFLPIIFLVIMAIKGITMPGGMDGLAKLFIPDMAAFSDAQLWIDAVGQVFYSMSIMMAIMFAYGSYLDESSNVAVDAIIIAFSDMLISVLAGVVMFSTMGGVGMLDQISDSGIATAFIVYPQAIVHLSNIGWLNAIFGFIFYMCLVTLAIDSAFSMVEGVSAAVSDTFKLNAKKVTIGVCVASGLISVIYATKAGLAWLDIVDNWTNQYNMLIIGVAECLAIGWFFNTSKVLDEINRNTGKFKVPAWWFSASIKVVAPLLLSILLGLKFYDLFAVSGGQYGDYPMWALVLGGWVVTIICMFSGLIVKYIKIKMKKNGFIEDEITWDEM